MQRNADLGHLGNIDNEGIDLPNFSPSVFNSDMCNNTNVDGVMDDADLLSVLQTCELGGTCEETACTENSLPPSTASRPQPTNPVQHPEIKEDMKNRFLPNYKFSSSVRIPTSAGARAGFKSPPTPTEETAIQSLKGSHPWIIRSRRHAETSNNKMTNGFHGKKKKGVEELLDFECSCVLCPCKLRIARADGHILCYEFVDKESGQSLEHIRHDDVSRIDQKQYRRQNQFGGKAKKEEEAKTEEGEEGDAKKEQPKPKFDSLSLLPSHHEFIRKFGMGLVAQRDWKSVAEAMKTSSECSLSKEQEDNIDDLSDRIKWYVKRQKGKGDPFFTNGWGKTPMSGNDVKACLDALKTPPSQRDGDPPLGNIPFTHSAAFKDAWEKMVVVDHDYDGDGSNFSYILLKYDDADDRAKEAVSMFLDGGCQLDMDFFVGVCPNDEWQVGHIGFSDLNHRYWILAVVISRSENHEAAGIILKSALSLLEEAGGKGNRILVDGGTALAKAIMSENEWRRLVEDVELELRRCLAHCLRRPFSRGGGYRGGKGSIHKALLDSKVPREIIAKIVGVLIMMTFIPPDKRESYSAAIDLLIKEYGDFLSKNFRAQYLTKDPNHLGGLCAGRAGEVASTQGGERRGGYIKNCHKQVCLSFGIGQRSRNPLMLVAALGRDGKRKQNKIENIAVVPNYNKAKKGYEVLRTLARYRVPDDDDIGDKRISPNFCSDFLYALVTRAKANGTGTPVEEEVSLHSVLGQDGAEFKIIFPSISTTYTELKRLKEEQVFDVIGGPAAMQMQTMSMEDVSKMLKDPRGCNRALTTLDHASQQTLKVFIHERLRKNTSNPRPGESCIDYVRRNGHRDESIFGGTRFARRFENSKKKSKRKSTKQQEKLEKDKWGGEEKDEEEDLGHFFEELEIWDDDAELEDTEEIIKTALLEAAKETVDGGDGVEGDADIFVFDEEEIAKLNSQASPDKRVRVLREMGDGVTVSVGRECCKTCCNCEMFNRWRICRHVIWIEVLHFRKFPTGDISSAEDGWEGIRERLLDIIKKTHIDISSAI